MQKKIIFWSLTSIILVSVFLVASSYLFQKDKSRGFNIEIENKTNVKTEIMYLTCNGIPKDVEISNIAPKKMKTFKIEPKNYGENVITLYYYDKNKRKQEKMIVGYFEESYGRGNAKIRIESIDKNGIMSIKSKYQLTAFYNKEWYGDDF